MNRIFRRLLGQTDAESTGGSTGDAARASPEARVAELIALGNALEDRGECEEALKRYREATTLDPTSSRTFVNVGNALQLLDRIDEAIAAQRTACSLRRTITLRITTWARFSRESAMPPAPSAHSERRSGSART